ncbi:MAG: hypothetical protein AB7U82_01920 [Blastocatellales bacterium]
MDKENTKRPETDASNVVEDLTLSETETDNVKGGRAYSNSFCFGVEREMKESGEKGGTE